MKYINYICFLLLVSMLLTSCSDSHEKQNAVTYETWSIIDGQKADDVSGFKYEDGYRYKIVVKVLGGSNSSAAKYEFVGVIEKVPELAIAN